MRVYPGRCKPDLPIISAHENCTNSPKPNVDWGWQDNRFYSRTHRSHYITHVLTPPPSPSIFFGRGARAPPYEWCKALRQPNSYFPPYFFRYKYNIILVPTRAIFCFDFFPFCSSFALEFKTAGLRVVLRRVSRPPSTGEEPFD